MFAHAPVHRNLAAAHGGAVGIHLLHQLVRRHRVGNRGQTFRQTLPLYRRDRGVARVGPLVAEERCPVNRVLALEVGQHRVHRVAARIERRAVGLEHVVAQRVTQPLGGEPIGIQLARAGVLGDLFVHQRLRDAGRVLLVVAQLAEADDVEHHILAEGHAVFQRELSTQHHRLGVITVHMQHRRLDTLDDVGAVQRGAQIARIGGGETDLVVDDDVHRAACGVAPGGGQCQRFLVHALTSKSGVAMYQHRQHLLALRVAPAVHAGAHRALHHRVHDLQV